MGTWIRDVVAFALALLAPALPTPGASAGNVSQDGSALTYQVSICPTDYTGTGYLTDCTAGPDPIGLTLSGNAGRIDLAGTTDENGFITFLNIPAVTVTASLDVPGDFARFYYACFAFDEASGDQIYQFDGTGNQLTQQPTGEVGSALLCRWYVTPESQGGPSPSPVASGTAQVEVYLCPTYYAGDDYLTDCAPATTTAIPVDLNPGTTYDPTNTETSYTDATGTAAFYDLAGRSYTMAVGVPGDFASFYSACFDTTSGSEIYLFDGDLNLITFALADGGDFSCRFYVIPEDLRGASASPSASASPTPSVRPTATPRASSSPTAINVLPSTGTGPDSGSPTDGLGLAIAAIAAVAGVGLATRRLARSSR